MSDPVLDNRLLVIDDEPAIGRLLRRVGKTSGFEVTATDDAQTFVRAARNWRPTVIILDLKMPGVDGVELIRTLAGDRCEADVIIASGSDPRVVEAAMRLGRERGLKMSGLIQKPVRVDALRSLLDRFSHISTEVLEADLRQAIEGEQLFLEYQPTFDLVTGRLTGVEALARWKHPRLGMVRPDVFVGLAERTALIRRLTEWAVRSATEQAAAWHAQNLPIAVAVNISARDVEELDLPERLFGLCIDAGANPNAIVFELTETGAMREAMQMMDVLTRLRLKGFRLSIDDFGTGYSSLVQLQRMPFSELKIDQSFVGQMMRNSGSRVIVEIIVELARKLGLRTIAEGVEDADTLRALANLHCDAVQGYHLGRPMSAGDIVQIAGLASCASANPRRRAKTKILPSGLASAEPA